MKRIFKQHLKLQENESFYIIKLKINKNQCLFSDFEKWHFVLNDWYLPFNLDDSNTNVVFLIFH